jgi:polyisoprenoid-binding protein YceI
MEPNPDGILSSAPFSSHLSQIRRPAPVLGFSHDTAHFPELTYGSTQVEVTGANTLRIHGELTLHGVTRPVLLNGTFNGGCAGHPMDPHARVGFSAHGSFKRSEFGVSLGVPPPGTQFGVGDEIDVTIETELSGPPYRGSAGS